MRTSVIRMWFPAATAVLAALVLTVAAEPQTAHATCGDYLAGRHDAVSGKLQSDQHHRLADEQSPNQANTEEPVLPQPQVPPGAPCRGASCQKAPAIPLHSSSGVTWSVERQDQASLPAKQPRSHSSLDWMLVERRLAPPTGYEPKIERPPRRLSENPFASVVS